MKKPEPFLLHIWDSIQTIKFLLISFDKQQFINDQRTQLAIIKLLEIIGEAAGNLEYEYKESLSEIDWIKVKNFRNKLVHDYWDIDLEIVWRVATQDIIVLEEAIKTTVKKIDESEIIEEW